MSEPIDWLPDGTPYSPRFGDRYHSENGGLDQARRVFLQGCGLPAAWAGQPQWRVLETGFGFGLNFLVTWAAWRADAHRPRLLHFISTEAWPVNAADLLRATTAHAELAPLAEQLHAQWWGLLPGVHRLAFEDGRVLLTLYVGDAQEMLRQQAPTADSVYLDGFSPSVNPEIWSAHTLKAVARCCRRGTQLATWTIARAVRDTLSECGFEVQRVPGVPPKRDNLHATYNPRWEPRARTATLPDAAQHATAQPQQCIVIGGGLAGAATAASLARRGWQVQVLDQASEPAAGASGLPAGVFAPHVSPDDAVLSRLSRCGVRTTLQQAQQRLQAGQDWGATGVLEHRTDGSPGLPADWNKGPGADWSTLAPPDAREQAGLPPDAVACWHAQAGWIRPAQMVRALLRESGVTWRGQCQVASLRPVPAASAANPAATEWQALDAQGDVLAQAPVVVIAAGAGSHTLLSDRWPLQPVRGQVSWGHYAAHLPPPAPFPANGHGNLVPSFGLGSTDQPGGEATERGWIMGSTFERDVTALPASATDQQAAHQSHWDKLQTLLPTAARQLQPSFDARLIGEDTAHTTTAKVEHWAAVRCTAPDRLPIVGPVHALALPGLWVCTAMGARGLTLALLCGELLAARLNAEPLPLDAKLARALSSERM
ncbi:FAD-dependent 5-carboxymethylaminomethyl-2-thiouridine(34) oxidoreductase MnmC [Acidovorax sp. 106]|uniref:FAD-dependent 5-carboxymethylaminomethyl-2-thiouridine(34) oxidoreductase MnmC n=1 Tax=Acidovorax sp. 106 TaxID=2135637 RepID=UPI000EACC935|nr:FAD-dependent 5-carboxymethylaminomethyl-2-thiouridine(34) oxidoreductase MnmC [Acidovorax sp. 106]RLJ40144.1 tRNA 5-methylaminomethyl-2-thiouridine biosynthesis bifunctional protein [Acidovorax sp. 106]